MHVIGNLVIAIGHLTVPTTHRYFIANGVLLVYDVTDDNSYMGIKNALSEWMSLKMLGTVFLLVGNNCHLSHLRTVSTEEAETVAKKHSAMFTETSFMEDMSGFDAAFLDFVRGQLWNDTL